MKKALALAITLASMLSCDGGPVCGGYTVPHSLNSLEKTIFKLAVPDSLGYTPKKVSTQVVAGYNYKYKCKDSHGKKCTIVVYDPIVGFPHVTEQSE